MSAAGVSCRQWALSHQASKCKQLAGAGGAAGEQLQVIVGSFTPALVKPRRGDLTLVVWLTRGRQKLVKPAGEETVDPCFLLSKVILLLAISIFYKNLKDSLVVSSAWSVTLNLPGLGLVMK